MLGAVERSYKFGPFRLDAVERVLLCRGDPTPLTPKAFETLLTLVKHHGRVVSKDDLIRWIWPDAVVEEATLSQNIFTVRNALRKGSSAAVIETVPKIGYRFVATVQTLTEWRPVPLAVLPFKPIHTEQRDESLELGLADAVITRLSTAPRILVRPMSAIRRFGDLRQDAVSAARELKVDLVLEGSVHRVDQSVRATARLLDVVGGRAIWAGVFNERAPDLFAVLDSISGQITHQLLRRLDATADDAPLDRIRELTRNWSPAQFERSYAPGKWTARQILIHLAQTEIGLGHRARMALTNRDYTAQPFDQDAWVARENTLSGAAALEALVGLHAMNQALFASLSSTERATPFLHPDYGPLTVDWIVQLLASHLTHHVFHFEQIAGMGKEINDRSAEPRGQPLDSGGRDGGGST
jgi:DNA-binding winged helix-turn-helix (wHTH) protein